MNNTEKKRLAYALYTKSSDKYTRKEIAKQVGVVPKTLRSWINEGDWDLHKDAMQITRPQLLQEAYAQLKAINKEIKENYGNVPNKEMADAKATIRKEIELLSDQPIHRYIEVFEEFIEWITRNEPKHMRVFGPLSQRFITDIAKHK